MFHATESYQWSVVSFQRVRETTNVKPCFEAGGLGRLTGLLKYVVWASRPCGKSRKSRAGSPCHGLFQQGLMSAAR